MTNTDATQQSAVALLGELGWKVTDCQSEVFGPGGTLGRETKGDVVLVDRLLPVLRRLNPTATEGALSLAVDELVRDRSSVDLVAANRAIHVLLRDGYRAAGSGEVGADSPEETVRYVDWDHPEVNEFLAAHGFGVTGESFTYCCDLVGFVNGVPMVVLEVKTVHRDLESAFNATVAEYEQGAPHLFWYNAFSIIANAAESRVGPIDAGWEHFGLWKRAATEEEAPWQSLETTIRGTCERSRFLDLAKNSLLFVNAAGGPVKLMAKNHQYLGVEAAIGALRDRAVNKGRLGMFWHAQGSGKGVSMILFAQKVLREFPGTWTFVVVTDRQEKEDQVCGRLAAAGLLKNRVRAETAKELRRVLSGRGRFVFVPIEQFAVSGPGGQYPLVSTRSDIIVMAVEAHQPQYEAMAANMRIALPDAAFIGFTGSPLAAGEDNHRQAFGDYVSIYNFRESVEDGITVPLYHENRLPEVQMDGAVLDRGLEQLLREAELDESREAALEAEFGRRYYAITEDERLDTVARDIVRHFTERGYLGKALVVSIDRITAARMCEKVRTYWTLQLAGLRLQVGPSTEPGADGDSGGSETAPAGGNLAYWESTDMAVVLPKSMEDVEEFYRRGVDVVPHLERASREDLIAKFNDPADPLRLVFTSANWIHGLDMPPCSTIYLDKPMRDHALMQTVSRAGRSFQRKTSGLIVDYLGVFQDPRKVLAAYWAGSGAGIAPGDLPVLGKSRQVKELRKALTSLTEFVRGAGFELDAIRRAPQLPKLRLVDEAIDAVLVTDACKEEFLARCRKVLLLYRAILPDPAAAELGTECALCAFMLKRIRMLTSQPGMSPLETRLVRLLDASIEAQGYGLRAPEVSAPESGRSTGVRKLSPDDAGLFGPGPVDLGRIDPVTVWKRFTHTQKNIEIERLRGALDTKLAELVRLNPSRAGLRDKLPAFVRDPGDDDIGPDALFARLIDLVQEVNAESGRAAHEGLKEEELALVDLLTQAEPAPSPGQGELVKTAVRELVADLKAGLLVAGWRKDRQSRASVRSSIEETVEKVLDLPSADEVVQKADLLFQHVYDAYPGGGPSVYGRG
ncbi:MAG: type I restriction endonuclease subunit R [Thermoleophilia bacterium]|nr:type I restriction endonuclease subunit R [Thermoleophilia bacterium]